MAVTYTWSITDLAVFSNSEYQDIIHEARWIINGDDGEHQASFRGITTFSDPDSTFVMYADITEETVLGWVKNELGAARVAAAEDVVNDQLEAAKYVDKPLPWVQQEPVLTDAPADADEKVETPS